LGDGATVALEGNVGDGTVNHLKVERQLVAAQRVDGLHRPARALELAEVPWSAGMIDDYFLVEARDVVIHCSTPWPAPESTLC